MSNSYTCAFFPTPYTFFLTNYHSSSLNLHNSAPISIASSSSALFSILQPRAPHQISHAKLTTTRAKLSTDHHHISTERKPTDNNSKPASTSPAPDSSSSSSLTLPPGAITFQDAILRLQTFWQSKGCVLAPPYNTEVGAGTMNPATYLRCLGPEPWNVAYEESCIRPDDSRYGLNPNRLQRHTQFQVILKPSPENTQQLLLESYKVLGIDVAAHDIRFVEDNWESPALGAWGLGWEVWLDGMEITQFTYFQQAGGEVLDQIALELTYGMERIIMALQKKNHFKDIVFADGISYGEVFMQSEAEMSSYNLDLADTSRNEQMFQLYEDEAKHLIQERLPVPAYNYILKASHTFNILDARGAIGLTERARYFGRMRNLAREVAVLWTERRKELDFPLLKKNIDEEASLHLPPNETVDWAITADKNTRQSLLLEIGTEELPADVVSSLCQQLKTLVPNLLKDNRLDFQKVKAFATPRRVGVVVLDVQTKQHDQTVEARGPPAKAAYDKDGNPTKALIGFCNGQGVDPATVFTMPDPKGVDYIYVKKQELGRYTGQILAGAMPSLIASLTFIKSMRWNASGFTFSRPIRWICALLGDQVIPFSVAGLTSGRHTRGLRVDGIQAQEFPVSTAHEYFNIMESLHINPHIEDRMNMIAKAANETAASIGGKIPEKFLTHTDDSLLAEVANLVETPSPILGTFDEAFLRIPDEVLITVMKKHQRYFPVTEMTSTTKATEPKLKNAFITFANGNCDEELVKHGNEDVVRARLTDADFFYKSDLAKPLEKFTPALAGVVFQAKLGSVLDKVNRITKFAPELAPLMGLTASEVEVVKEAAPICKSDSVTSMVVEFTGLTGVMGRHYALKQGIREEVAEAIFEHNLPRNAGDILPVTKPGILLSVSDRLDSMVGLFSAGMVPKSTADPFALRRTTVGLVQLLINNKIDFDMSAAIDVVAKHCPIKVKAEDKTAVIDFVAKRMEVVFAETGYRIDHIRAVLAVHSANPALASSILEALNQTDVNLISTTLEAYGRPARLIRSQKQEPLATLENDIDMELLESEPEKQLYASFVKAKETIDGLDQSQVKEMLETIARMKPEVDAFFDNVMVMVDDAKLKNNRLALCAKISQLASKYLDLTDIEGF